MEFRHEEFPPKEKDPGSFVLPCIIGNTTVSNVLADLGASISVMPFSMFRRLGLGNPRPVNMVIEMADRSMQSPKGIVENVLVKIHKFIFLVDFVILDIIEDNKVSIILGKPMQATAHDRIDVFGGKISFRYDFVAIDDLWDNLDLGSLTNKQFLKPEFPSIGSRVIGKESASVHRIPLLLTDFIILENVNEFVEKGLAEVIFGKPFKEEIGLEEDISKGIIWFKTGDDKTIFNMP
ncbi:retrovirus-related pol polyprotein from transposon TNT 1-94 [Tanacetum coccineum]|uniref:Retrovirus-related pol polyprotein from transposon TNT 1-94 n=1 Tax=Tanacetum coccineum TaxID=301880 RepID=A0ABQ4YFJ2_9ASTR